MAYERVAWPKLRDYFFRLSNCTTRQELYHTSCVEIQQLIPYDETAGIFNSVDSVNIEGFGKSDACTAAYNSYYRAITPEHPSIITDWRNFDCEFTVDFIFPNGLYKSLAHRAPEHRVTMRIHRSQRSPNFSESDVVILDFVNDYLNNLDLRFDEHANIDSLTSAATIAERFRCLTRRESEVCSLLLYRLTTAEIAARLFLSRRTVECHVANIFDKLQVHTREQLRWKVGVLLPAP